MSSSVCQQINISASIHAPPFCSPRFHSFLVLSPLHPLRSCCFPSLSSVYPPWRGPVMSAPSSDKPSLSRRLFFYSNKRLQERRPGSLLLCCAADRSLSGGWVSGTEEIWRGCLPGASKGGEGDERMLAGQDREAMEGPLRGRVMWRT